MKKQTLLGLLLLALLVLSVGYANILSKEGREKEDVHETVMSEQSPQEKYRSARDEFVTLLQSSTPSEVLAEVRQRILSDNDLARSCHNLVHEIGHAAYEKYGDFGSAIAFQDEICNSGYLHGVIESHFADAEDLLATLNTTCSAYSPTSFMGWECFHGIGHGLMFYTYNDLPASLTWCDVYTNVGARSACVNGVFMENFNTEEVLHPSAFISSDDYFYPCAEQEGRHKTDCYFYAPTHYLSANDDAYEEAFSWCLGAPEQYRSTCISGTGSQAMKDNINEPLSIESLCMRAPAPYIANCVSGLVGLYINHHGALEPARALCERLMEENREGCRTRVGYMEPYFE